MRTKSLKNIILTIDYELFFGKESGSVHECMIKPTNKLIALCKDHECSMTVFWDILHYYMLLKLEHKFPDLKQDRISIELQIEDLVRCGHDIQLHIHPHWLDSEYINSKWVFKYERFSIQKLSDVEDEDDINTISGCVKICKELIEGIVKKIDPLLEVNTIRAGGYLIEPFSKLSKSLKDNNIKIDSSVCPNRKIDKGDFSFNFESYPDLLSYNFEETPSKIDPKGFFVELPIQAIFISRERKFIFNLIKKFKYKNLGRYGDGIGNQTAVKLNLYQKISNKIVKLIRSEYGQLTTDNCFEEKYNYLLKKSKNYSVQILHPKIMNSHTLKLMRTNLEQNKIKFISINKFFKLKNEFQR